VHPAECDDGTGFIHRLRSFHALACTNVHILLNRLCADVGSDGLLREQANEFAARLMIGMLPSDRVDEHGRVE
jgi:hypothetical protein